ncbi:FGGY-family carbohydrate kinase [Sphingobacterium yanglingense]|uniref:Sugar (Pentulose or hexulose) kinase n=1 Tax=Sphingobacterium yanglingense TaxID=1437280 RepID=A0A4R6WMT9_9SPHI|nr:FGGY family carbohydrate kinase [Sphingobacterium yanglingense]TDQ80158.1 sugar (pentulose or hexulose) kinase [Sphingobacterium yanglingense]
MMSKRIPVIAIFDVGKTNKKLFLFNEKYQLLFERSARFNEVSDEDGDPCENLESLRLSIFDSLHEIFRSTQYEIKAINFASYGASLVYLDKNGHPLAPLYNYLKPYPEELSTELYDRYQGEEAFCLSTASPALGSLNSGLQLYRLKRENGAVYEHISYALHLPQYLSFLLSGVAYTDKTSIGCHTALWDFERNDYHSWVTDEGVDRKLAPIVAANTVYPATFPGSTIKIGVGLHDSSSALIPYLLNFHEPFILISTGTWCISFNPFNADILCKADLDQDCLFYYSYLGNAVKASRLFAGYEHDRQAKRIADHFNESQAKLKHIDICWETISMLRDQNLGNALQDFQQIELKEYDSFQHAYHALMLHLVKVQIKATKLVLGRQPISRIFVDGGFSKNNIYMNLLAYEFSEMEVFAASMAQATAIGAALAIHDHWNTCAIPNNIIELTYYRN